MPNRSPKRVYTPVDAYINSITSAILKNCMSMSELLRWWATALPNGCALYDQINICHDVDEARCQISSFMSDYLKTLAHKRHGQLTPWSLAMTRDEITTKFYGGKPRITLPVILTYGKKHRVTERQMTEDFAYALLIAFQDKVNYTMTIFGSPLTMEYLPKFYSEFREVDILYRITLSNKIYYGESAQFLQGFIEASRMWHTSLRCVISGLAMVSYENVVELDY